MLSIADLFKGRHFDREIIILCGRWYLRFKLSFRDLVEMTAERGVRLAHTTIMRWIGRYVPALPAAGVALEASSSQMQLTIIFYVTGLPIGQLIYGPASDRFGRRPPRLIELVLYTLANTAAVLAQNIGTLVIARAFAALGGCSGMVVARVVVRDTTKNMNNAAKRLALMNVMVVIGSGLAPTIGGLLAAYIGWRSIFIFLIVLGVANLYYALYLLPETRPKKAAGSSPGQIL